jgi:hypothetical protein
VTRPSPRPGVFPCSTPCVTPTKPWAFRRRRQPTTSRRPTARRPACTTRTATPTPALPDRFRHIQAAYDILSDDARRRDYDALRRRNLIDDPLQEATSLWASYIEKVIS